MPIIISTIIIMFIILIGWTWSSLGNIESKTKIIYIAVGCIVTYLVTFLIYNISKIGIKYENKDAMNVIRNVFVIIFSIINGYIYLPFLFRKIEQINFNQIDKTDFIKSLKKVIIIYLVIIIVEIVYLKNIQVGILNSK